MNTRDRIKLSDNITAVRRPKHGADVWSFVNLSDPEWFGPVVPVPPRRVGNFVVGWKVAGKDHKCLHDALTAAAFAAGVRLV
jgi:hypothetical protein